MTDPDFLSLNERMVQRLAREFPDRCPHLGQSTEEVWFRAGQASVVRYLRARLDPDDDD